MVDPLEPRRETRVVVAPDAERFDRLAPIYDQIAPFFSTVGARLVDWTSPRQNQRILDIACGRGAVTAALARALRGDCEIVAGDVSEEMLSRLRALELPGVEVKYLDATDIAEADDSFDVIFSAFLLHFLARASEALSEIARVLRPSGRFAMSVPGSSDDDGWWDVYDGIVKEFATRIGRTSRRTVQDESWGARADEAGLRVIARSRTEVALPLESREQHWQWLLAHSVRGLYDALDTSGQAELHSRVLRSLRDDHPAGGTTLILGADFYQFALT